MNATRTRITGRVFVFSVFCNQSDFSGPRVEPKPEAMVCKGRFNKNAKPACRQNLCRHTRRYIPLLISPSCVESQRRHVPSQQTGNGPCRSPGLKSQTHNPTHFEIKSIVAASSQLRQLPTSQRLRVPPQYRSISSGLDSRFRIW